VDPRNDEVYYIGKGKEDRTKKHLQPYYLRKDTPTNRKHKEILSENLKPLFIKVKEDLEEWEAFNLERDLIDSIGLDNLTNLCNGGGGCAGYSPTKDQRERMSRAQKRYLENHKHSWEGKKHSEETRKKMSRSATGRKHTKRTKKRLSVAMKGENNPNFGKSRSEETRRKISEANKGKPGSWMGKKHTKETRKKMSEARKKYWKHRRNKQ
jgi:hypothetical protein